MPARSVPEHLKNCFQLSRHYREVNEVLATGVYGPERAQIVARLWEMCTRGDPDARTRLAVWLLSGEIELTGYHDLMSETIPLLAKGGHREQLETLLNHVSSPIVEHLVEGLELGIRHYHLKIVQMCVAHLIKMLDGKVLRGPKMITSLIHKDHPVEYVLAIQPIIDQDPREVILMVASLPAIEYFHRRKMISPYIWGYLIYRGSSDGDIACLAELWRIRRMFNDGQITNADLQMASFAISGIRYGFFASREAMEVCEQRVHAMIPELTEYHNLRKAEDDAQPEMADILDTICNGRNSCQTVIAQIGPILNARPDLVHYQDDRIYSAIISQLNHRRELLSQWFLQTYSLGDQFAASCDFFTTHRWSDTMQTMSAHFQQAAIDWQPVISYRGSSAWYGCDQNGQMVLCHEELPIEGWFAYLISGVYVYFQAIYLRDGTFRHVKQDQAELSDQDLIDVCSVGDDSPAITVQAPIDLATKWAPLFCSRAKSARSAIDA